MIITPLPQGFGAEVSEFDLQQDCTPGHIAQLQQAYKDHHLLVFRDSKQLPPERQAEVAGWFGPVGANATEGRLWTVLNNDEATGRDELPFHCDISFFEFPLEGISLQPLALPANGTSTSYVSNAVGWDRLSEEMRRELQGRKVRHHFTSSAEMNLGMPAFEYWHPARLPHPQTGRPLLFVTEGHVDRIEGLSEARSAEILKQLFAEIYAPERRYEHLWHEGDLVIWNNLAIQHARTRAAEPAQGSRVLRRVALGKVSFAEQLERLRQQA